MKEYDINNLLNDIDFNKNKYVKVNNNLILTNYQIEVLERLKIDVKNKTTLNEILLEAEDVYEETLDEELEIILEQLSERNYYENTNK